MWSKISNSKCFYMIVAVICAIVCWLYVDIVEAPDMSKQLRSIPVTFIGEDALADEGLMITSGKDTTVTLTIRGARAILSQIDRSNVTITVQAATQITEEGHYDLDYSVSWPSTVSRADITVTSSSVSSVGVDVVQMTSKTLPIQGQFTGSIVPGAVCNESDFQFKPDTVTVSGERSQVELVDRAEVILSELDLSSTWSGMLDVVLKDKDGNILDLSERNLSCDVDSVYTIFPVKVMKEVPLTVDVVSGGGASAEDITYEIEPKTVTISGTPEQLEQIESIRLGTIDPSTIVTSDVLYYDIVVPDGVSISSGASTAAVRVSVSGGLNTRAVTTSDIEFINCPEGIRVEPVTQSLTVRIRGAADIMELVMDEDVYVIVDLANLDEAGTGTQTLPARIVVRGFADVGAVGEYQVTATITRG